LTVFTLPFVPGPPREALLRLSYPFTGVCGNATLPVRCPFPCRPFVSRLFIRLPKSLPLCGFTSFRCLLIFFVGVFFDFIEICLFCLVRPKSRSFFPVAYMCPYLIRLITYPWLLFFPKRSRTIFFYLLSSRFPFYPPLNPCPLVGNLASRV